MSFAARPTDPTQPPKGRFTAFSTSGYLTPLLVGTLCLLLVGAAVERGRGYFHHFSSAVDPDLTVQQPLLKPGGQEAVRLSRSATAIGQEPELTSVTLLPGRGMNVLQITANIPGHGEVNLLMSPDLKTATGQLTGEDADSSGALSSSFGGALMLPWAEHLSGTPAGEPGDLQASWRGERLSFPATSPGAGMSTEGLLLKRGAASVQTGLLADGQSARAVFHAGNFDGSWPSNTEVTVLVELSSHTLDLTVTAQNTGSAPEPFGVGWHPYFAIPSGDRAAALLTLPSLNVLERNGHGQPTGRTTSVDGTGGDFTRLQGTKLGTTSIDATYTVLRAGALSEGPVADLRDPGDNILLRLTALTPNITSLRVVAPANKSWVSINPDTNVDDPLGREWTPDSPGALSTLAPGQTLQWKVRLELSSLGPLAQR